MTDDNPEQLPVVSAKFQVGYTDEGVVITWVEEESGQPHGLVLSLADALALAYSLLRAIPDHADRAP